MKRKYQLAVAVPWGLLSVWLVLQLAGVAPIDDAPAWLRMIAILLAAAAVVGAFSGSELRHGAGVVWTILAVLSAWVGLATICANMFGEVSNGEAGRVFVVLLITTLLASPTAWLLLRPD